MTQFVGERDLRGSPVARCTCDDCAAEIVVKSSHTTRFSEKRDIQINRTQALQKLNDAGWTFVKNVLRCQNCEAKRKEPIMAKTPAIITITPPAAAPLRQPTREQKRLIVTALEEAYDAPKQRYKGTETDKGIAEMLADGTMPGWVAAVREDMFGPDGNEEMTDLAGEVAAWMKKADRALATTNEAISEFVAARAKVKEIGLRLDKIVAAVGPKAERA